MKGLPRVSFWLLAITVIGLSFANPQSRAATSANPKSKIQNPKSNWLSAVQSDIRQSEYHVTWQEETYLPDGSAAYQSPNRAHNLRTYFTPEGIVVMPRTGGIANEANGANFVLGLRLMGVGDAAETVVSTNRLEYRRGGLTEWYVNDESGLEQGFTLTAPPLPPRERGRGEGESFAIELSISGNLIPTLTADGRALEFTTTDGKRVLRYGDLAATDANGRDLPITMSLDNGRLQVEAETARATFPITIRALIRSLPDNHPSGGTDGLSEEPDWTAESNQDYAHFAVSGTAGDVNGDGYGDVIVGAYDYDNGQTGEGRAFVYHGSASGLSITPAWTAEGDQTGAWFGVSVGTAGDVNGDGHADVIVGAPYYDNDQSDEGRAYVYHGSPSGLSPIANWITEGDQTLAAYGHAVGTAGDVNGDNYTDVIVGALYYDSGQTDEGQARVFHGSISGLNPLPNWTAESDQADAELGYYALGTAGDVNGDGYADVIIGSFYYQNGEYREGRAFAWYGSITGLGPNGNPSNADWTAESNQENALFGYWVSTAGDVNGDGYADAIVGAYNYDNGETDEGRAFAYYGSSTGLSLTANWTAESNQAGANFGNPVGTAGDVNGDGYADVVVGASAFDNGQTNEGQVFVYYGSVSGLNSSANWTADGNQDLAYFGGSAGTAGDVNGDGYADLIVGAGTYDNGQTDEGAVFVYHGAADGLSTTANWTAESDQDSSYFGYPIHTAGDVNGDGYTDIIVGAYQYDNGQSGEGRIFAYYGSEGGLSLTPDWTAESDQDYAYFGNPVDTTGDVNGDGYTDVIARAYAYDNGQTNEGAVFVYHGSASGLSLSPNWTAESNQVNAYFGTTAGAAGDINGDGYGDVIVGASSYENGWAFVYHGSAGGLNLTPNWMAEGDQAGAQFGWPVGTAGDVNGDGYSDVIIGSHAYDNGGGSEGRTFVYHGSAAGLSTLPSWTAGGDQSGAQFGYSGGTAGDVNGDGYSDVVIGALLYDNGQVDEGRTFVYHGSADGLATVPYWTAESDQTNAQFGYSVGTAGDVNGDGYGDVIIGALLYDNGQVDEGRAFVYFGSTTGLTSIPDWTAESDQAYAWFGRSVGTAGDINGDGYAEVAIGTDRYDNNQTDEGRAFVYYGNGSAGLSLSPRQRRSDNSAPLAHLGRSEDNAFRLALLGRTPFGRGKVKLQWEVKPLGVLFDGTGLQQSATWLDTGTAGVQLNQLVSNLAADTVYHWRVRLLYHPATTPFQQYSRWLTMPWNGWQEADLRTGTEGGPTPTPTYTPTPTSTPTPPPTSTPPPFASGLLFLPVTVREYVDYFDGATEIEPNNTYQEANGPLRSGRVYTGFPRDTNDYFTIYLPTGGHITIVLTGIQPTEPLQLQLRDGNTSLLDYVAEPGPYEIGYDGPAGTYYIRIYAADPDGDELQYSLVVTYP
ncbi:MAG: VCBS repeat-containing protein [Chloroflexota bacterium]